MSKSSTSDTTANNKCFLKVHGIGQTPFLMELVPYDTIKTVRNLLTNVLKNEVGVKSIVKSHLVFCNLNFKIYLYISYALYENPYYFFPFSISRYFIIPLPPILLYKQKHSLGINKAAQNEKKTQEKGNF